MTHKAVKVPIVELALVSVELELILKRLRLVRMHDVETAKDVKHDLLVVKRHLDSFFFSGLHESFTVRKGQISQVVFRPVYNVAFDVVVDG